MEREKRGAGAGNCNGGRGVYKTFCYGTRTGDARREASVQKCFDRLASSFATRSGCRTTSEGQCRCTVDSPYLITWQHIFREARERLYQQCHGFTNHIMERYEGKMYLTATCN